MSIFKWTCDEIKNIVMEILYGYNDVIRVNALAGETTFLNAMIKR